MENTQSPRARPGIKALAEATGYSIATVSKALNGSPMVAPATKALIHRAAAEIGYRANARGMALRTGRTCQAAVLMPVTAARDYNGTASNIPRSSAASVRRWKAATIACRSTSCATWRTLRGGAPDHR